MARSDRVRATDSRAILAAYLLSLSVSMAITFIPPRDRTPTAAWQIFPSASPRHVCAEIRPSPCNLIKPATLADHGKSKNHTLETAESE